jgi:hypothetical protein
VSDYWNEKESGGHVSFRHFHGTREYIRGAAALLSYRKKKITDYNRERGGKATGATVCTYTSISLYIYIRTYCIYERIKPAYP